MAQSNNIDDIVGQEERFKFLDDLSVLEVINLLSIGISSYNIKHHVPSDIPVDNGYIEAKNLKSQQYLNAICTWTDKQKMKLNTKKSNIMIFNPTKKFKFTTRLTMNNFTLPVINKTKLLGTIITDDLKWNSNTEEIVKKANQRMLLLRKSSEFTTKIEDLKAIYLSYVRGTLEQSSVLWGSTLSEENKLDIERVQKNACRIILGKNYTSYEESLHLIGLETLEERRKHLALKFGENCIDNKKQENYSL